MKSTTFALGALLLSLAIAQPHRHLHKHKRNQEVVWVTDYDYVTEIAKVTTTIWVSAGFVAPSGTPATPTPKSSAAPSQTYPANHFLENPSKGPKSSSTSTSSSSSSSSSSSTSTSAYVAPTPESIYVAPPPPTYVAPAVPISVYVPEPVHTPEPVVVAPVAAPAAPVAAPVAPVAAPVPAPVVAPTYPSSSGGVCSAGSPCSGDITYYEAGLGACGETTNGSVEKVIALPVGMMGAQSNGNPYCGMTVSIKKGGKTITATVVDKCMGCEGNSIDLSNAAFIELAEFAVGRTTAEWWFN